MKRVELLEQIGVKVLGWEFRKETSGPLPDPPDDLLKALEGKRGPVFWCCGDPNKKLLFYAAETGHAKAVLWDPLEDGEQLRRIINEAESKLGFLPYDDGATPREICEAILKALAQRVIAELEPLINRYGAFLEANAHLIYGIPASRLETTLETTPEELKAALLRYGCAIRDCNLLDEQTRQILRNGYCELARVLPEVEGDNDKDSVHLDRIAAETIRLIQEFDSQFTPVA
jgi:hypothetical protein